MASDVRVSIEPDAGDEDVATVEEGLLEFNREIIGDPDERPVRIFLRDDRERVVGGLLGSIRWRWMYVGKLWVSREQRGHGQGAAIMKAAESLARESGCLGIYLDTFEYQARPFYEKLGFSLFGTLEGYPPGYRQYYLARQLSSTPGD